MAVALRLGDVWAKALDYSDFTNSEFPNTDRKADIANAALTKLHYAAAASGQNYACDTATIDVVSGTSDYDLPKDFFRLLKLYLVEDGVKRAVRRVTFEMANGMETTPTEDAELELDYVLVAPKFKNPPDDDEVIETNFPDGFDDVVALEIAKRLTIKAEKPVGDLKAEADEFMRMVRDSLEPRDAGEPTQMVDVHQRFNRPWPFTLVRPSIADIKYMLFGNKLRIFQTDSREI